MISKKEPCFRFRNSEGAEYEVYFVKPNKAHYGEGTLGLCESPEFEHAKIYVSPYLSEKSELNTIIHEICHAFFWDKQEARVNKFANTVAGLLYREGWRKDKTKKNKKPSRLRKSKNEKEKSS